MCTLSNKRFYSHIKGYIVMKRILGVSILLSGLVFETYTFICPSNCMFSQKNETHICNNITGACLHGCKSGFAGANCSAECPKRCGTSNILGNLICKATSGKCIFGCEDGAYGAYCEHLCSDVDNNCKKCSTDKESRHVCDECIFNFYRGEKKCQECSYWCGHNLSSPLPTCRESDGYCNFGCKVGYYGDRCERACSQRCLDGECEQQTGICSVGCVTGMFGGLCNRPCSKCLQATCNRKDGTCSEYPVKEDKIMIGTAVSVFLLTTVLFVALIIAIVRKNTSGIAMQFSMS